MFILFLLVLGYGLFCLGLLFFCGMIGLPIGVFLKLGGGVYFYGETESGFYDDGLIEEYVSKKVLAKLLIRFVAIVVPFCLVFAMPFVFWDLLMVVRGRFLFILLNAITAFVIGTLSLLSFIYFIRIKRKNKKSIFDKLWFRSCGILVLGTILVSFIFAISGVLNIYLV